MNRQRNLWPKTTLAGARAQATRRFTALGFTALRAAGSRMRHAAAALCQPAFALCQPIVDLLLPPRCAGCGAESEHFPQQILLCEACRETFTDCVHERCRRCGAIAAAACPACAKRRPRFDRLVTLGSYAGPMRDTVLRLKRPGHEALVTAMGQWLAARVLATIENEDEPLVLAGAIVMPTPMHWMRRVAQQANSPDLLAAALATRLRLPLSDTWLVRRRNTRKQGPMLRTERLQNVRGAFALRDEAVVREAHVILVDDVVTTGATCDEMARVLRRAGARRVTVATLARADGPR